MQPEDTKPNENSIEEPEDTSLVQNDQQSDAVAASPTEFASESLDQEQASTTEIESTTDQDQVVEAATTPEVVQPTAPAVEEPVSETLVVPSDEAPTQQVVTPVLTETPTATEPSPVIAPVIPPASTSKFGSKKKLGIIAGIVAVIVLLAAGGAGAYFGLVLPNQPQKITQDALVNTADSQSLQSTKFEGEIGISGGQVADVVSGIQFEGGTSMKDKSFDLKLNVNTVVTKITLDARAVDDKSLFVKLSGLKGLDTLLGSYLGGDPSASAQYGAIIAQVNEQWFEIDEALLGQVPGADSIKGDNSLSSEDAQKIGDIYKNHQFLQIDKRLDDQDIHGVSSYHVQVTVKKDELKAFLGEVKSANISAVQIQQSDIDSLDKVDFSKYPFDLWVGKKDRIITQVSTTIENEGTTYKVRVALKDINQPITVEKPTDTKSILELLGGLSPSLGGGAGATSPLLGL